ncbi:hypothetical protein DCAR_0624522 [Daucus carota subsp. sativus]|uniref:Uncharacterized protein n=1 Tax=Daucus carota subsp. sativus TaxID=79200 RepID=A0A161XE28_DAUCS|nr:hypothetical protein DCAR_0624522 [Daucus carota subsp. sativus]
MSAHDFRSHFLHRFTVMELPGCLELLSRSGISIKGMKAVVSLRGPKGGMIFFKKDPVLGVDLGSAINNAVFPGLQAVVSNCRSLASKLIGQGYELLQRFLMEFVRLWYPNLRRTTSVRLVINQPAWSSSESEDERENLSFPSEDFCSSSSASKRDHPEFTDKKTIPTMFRKLDRKKSPNQKIETATPVSVVVSDDIKFRNENLCNQDGEEINGG